MAACPVAFLFLKAHPRPLVAETLGQYPPGDFFHSLHAGARADAGGGAALHGCGRVEVIARHDARPADLLDGSETRQRHFFSFAVGHTQGQKVVRRAAVAFGGLHAHLIILVVFAEGIDVLAARTAVCMAVKSCGRAMPSVMACVRFTFR